MINSFYVENYKNITMACKIKINPGISFLYGTCGSGKTNFCSAFSDISLDSRVNVSNNGIGARFEYGFQILDVQIWCGYTRNDKGEPYHIEIVIPQYQYIFVQEQKIPVLSDVWTILLEESKSDGMRQIVSQFRKESMGIEPRIPELLDSRDEFMLNKWQKDKAEHQIRHTDPSIFLLWDDADSSSQNLLKEQIVTLKQRGGQGLFVVRGSQWFQDQYTSSENYYVMKKGNPQTIISQVKKDIRNSKQLKRFL